MAETPNIYMTEQAPFMRSAALPDQDLSGGVADLLRKATVDAHEVVQRPAIVNALITGSIPLRTHVQYLICLHRIYATLERVLSLHPDHAALATTYNPAVLSRAPALEHDIRHFLALSPDADWTTHHWATSLAPEVKVALLDYTERLRALGGLDVDEGIGMTKSTNEYIYTPAKERPDLLLAHSYVRYMGDLSGGQAIRKAVATSYSLSEETMDGQRFYFFNDNVTPAAVKELKRVFRAGIDKAGESMPRSDRVDLMQEANHAFELNVRLFASFSSTYAAEQVQASVLPDQVTSVAVTPSAPARKRSTSKDQDLPVMQILALLLSCIAFAVLASYYQRTYFPQELSIHA